MNDKAIQMIPDLTGTQIEGPDPVQNCGVFSVRRGPFRLRFGGLGTHGIRKNCTKWGTFQQILYLLRQLLQWTLWFSLTHDLIEKTDLSG